MNIKELIEKIEDKRTIFGNFQGCGVYWEDTKEIIKGLDELSHPVIPEYLARWINYCKFTNVGFIDAITINEIHFYNYANQSDLPKLKEFLSKEYNQEIFIRAWFNEYEIEKDKRYLVKIKSTGQCLGKYYINNETLSPRFIYTGRNADVFTRKELEVALFEWVFDCEGIEIEEVEE